MRWPPVQKEVALKSIGDATEDLPHDGWDAAETEDRAGGKVIGGRLLRLRWAATCIDCGRSLVPGDRAWWFHLEDVGRCVPCSEPGVAVAPVVAAPPVERSTRPVSQAPSVASPPAAPVAEQRPADPPEVGAPKPERAAGASAQAEYERRRRRDKARTRQNLPIVVPVVLAAPFVGYLGVRAGASLVDYALGSIASSAVEGGVDTGPVFESGHVHVAGLVVGLALATLAFRFAFAPRQSTEAWRVGAEGERMTARALAKLPSSYRVLHDLPMPRSKANIDHVVVGPTGVFTVETKNYKNGVTIKGGQAFSAGRRLDRVVQQALRQAAAVADQTGSTVTPVVCVHGTGVRLDGWSQKPVVGGVRFCSGGRLRKTIVSYPADLDDAAVQQLARQLG